MKKVYGLLLALIVSAAAMAQATPHEKEVLRNDVARERTKRNDAARDIVHAEPGRARADNHAAVRADRKLRADARQVHRNESVRRRYHPHVRHHYSHYHHRRHYTHHTTVVIRH